MTAARPPVPTSQASLGGWQPCSRVTQQHMQPGLLPMARASPGLSGCHFTSLSSCQNVEVEHESQCFSREPQCNLSLPGAKSQARASRTKVLSTRKTERKGLRERDHLSHVQITWWSHFPKAGRQAIPHTSPTRLSHDCQPIPGCKPTKRPVRSSGSTKPCAPWNQSSRARPSQAGKQRPEAWQHSIPFQTEPC